MSTVEISFRCGCYYWFDSPTSQRHQHCKRHLYNVDLRFKLMARAREEYSKAVMTGEKKVINHERDI